MAGLEDRLRCARAYADLSQTELAERLGISLGTVKRREAGEAKLNSEALLATAQACEVPFAFLVEGWCDQQLNASVTEILDRLQHGGDPPVLPGPDSLPGE